MKIFDEIHIICLFENQLITNSIKKIFSDHEIVTIENCCTEDEFFQKYFEKRPDIIILNIEEDQNFNELNPIEIIFHIRNQLNDPNVYILVLLPSNLISLREKIMELSPDDIVLKPIISENILLFHLNVAKRHLQLIRQLSFAYERISKEVDFAINIQQKLLPKFPLESPSIFIDFFYEPSGRASGDYFDFFYIDKNLIRVLIADVSGHGSRAAALMIIVSALFKSSKMLKLELKKLVELLNEELIEIIKGDFDIVTLFVADIDIEKKEIKYVNAGHCPAFLIDKKRDIRVVGPNNAVLGVVKQDFSVDIFSYNNLEGILLLTDGYYEWEFDSENIWGLESFLETLQNILARERKFSLDILENYIKNLCELPPIFRDDRTALWIQFSND